MYTYITIRAESVCMYTYITIRAVQCSSVHMCVCVCVCVQAELELHQAVLQMNIGEQIIIKVAVLNDNNYKERAGL